MKSNKTTSYGTIEKKENITTINIPDGLDTLVYESISPFKGYYDNFPDKHNNITYLYLPIDNYQNFIDLHRIIIASRCSLDKCIDMDYAELTYQKQPIYAIRVRGFDDLSQVAAIQKTLSAHSVKFTAKKTQKDFESVVRITKYFFLDKQNEGIWLDSKVEKHGYIELAKYLNHKDFTSLLKSVKNNWSGYTFDAAQATLCSEDKVVDMVRIYSKHVKDEGYLSDLKKVFNSLIK